MERLAWRTSGGGAGAAAKVREGGGPEEDRGDEDDSTALQLHDAFVEAIKQLTQMHDAQKKKCDALEVKVRDEEQQHWRKVAKLLDRNRQAAAIYKSLDERINSVATKVVHLGDQLESVNTPRARDSEALRLMKHFDEFLGGETNLSPVFNDKSRLHEAADIIQKLQLIAQELPPRRKCFQDAIAGIEKKYAEIERALIEEFVKSHRSGDYARMKEIASILSHFRGYSQCVDAFIEQIQLQHSSAAAAAGVQGLSLLKGGAGGGREKDVFKEVVPLCEKSWALIGQVS